MTDQLRLYDETPLVCIALCNICGAICDVIPVEGDGPYDNWNAGTKFALIAIDAHKRATHDEPGTNLERNRGTLPAWHDAPPGTP